VIDLRHGRWEDVLGDVECDALICDPPYSARTHEGHDGATRRDPGKMKDPGKLSRPIPYATWDARDVSRFVEYWAPRTRGWFVSITDHLLARSWEHEMQRAGLYVFAPLPLVEIGSRIRLAGDGPSTWTCWIVVARPKNREMQRWGTLPGAYVDNCKRDKIVMGGKPLDLMRAIIRDYSRPGDLICDPCAGGATTLIAAHMEGRRSIGSERSYATAELAAARIEKHLRQQPLFAPAVAEPEQEALFT
jgi:site-specific DNA-methyltransferase (adenine-specific)